ncbi:CLUMA_CG008733, isoform A [Clunio marinus]|uniref:CLUMA_CG008733, isoform A n=1 Tax=Clunio marinus TaxID=568069 RepID=A0A1J1IA81_9DIPT|nr:CLUMA_CG008733, isoform A [Clunio marinus]
MNINKEYLETFSKVLNLTLETVSQASQYIVQRVQHLSLSSVPDDMLHINNLQPSDTSENEQQMSHMDQGSEMDEPKTI